MGPGPAESLRASKKPKPVITSSPEGDVLTGNSVTLTCTLTPQSTGWRFYWTTPTQSTETVTHSSSSYPSSSDHTISSVSVSDGGQYKCRAGREVTDDYTDYSETLSLSVTEKPKPVITSSRTGDVLTGNSVTLTCTLTPQSTGWKFYWYKDNQQLKAVTVTNSYTFIPVFRGESVTFRCDIQTGGDTEWTYSWYRDNSPVNPDISSVTDTHGGQYTCRGTRKSDSQLSQISAPVTLSVSEKPKLQFTSSLGDVLTGNPVTLTCTLTPQSTGWTFYWEKNSQSKTETNTHTYTFSPVSVSDRGRYWCYARRGNPVYFTHYSNALQLDVTVSPKPVVNITPDKQVFRGERVTFRCDIQTGGDTEWTYSWYKNDNTQTPHRTTQEFTDHYYYSSGKYTCRGTRKSDSQLSQISAPVTLSVSEKPKLQFTSSLKGNVLTGNSVTLTCTLTPQSTGWTFYWTTPTQSTVTHTHTYTFSPVSVSDRGRYWCYARRGSPEYTTDYSNALQLVVTDEPSCPHCLLQGLWSETVQFPKPGSDVRKEMSSQRLKSPKPVVIIKPDTQVYRGERVTLSCTIPRDTEWTYSLDRDGGTVYSSHTTKVFTVTDSDGGKYTCRGTRRRDSQLSQISHPVTLSVSEKPKPDLTSDPKGETLTGKSVTLTCTLKLQSAGWKFYWKKERQSNETETAAISDNSSSSFHYYSHYNITPVSVSDGGQYRCRAGRGNPVYYTHYSDALWVNVTVSPKAVVRINLDNHVFSGEKVTLRCDIQGGGDSVWTYSWYKNNTLHPNTTQEFNLSSVTIDNGGKYTCRGRRSSDSQSSEISDALTLTVSDPAETVVSVSPLSWLTEGDSVTLSCEVKHSSTGWTFSWYTDVPYRDSQGSLRYRTALLSDSSRGSGGSYTLSPVTLNHTGVYMCRAERGEPVFHTHYSKPQPLWVTVESPPVSLIISPSRTQHFTNDSLSLSCKDQRDSTGWTVRGHTNETLFNCSSVSGSTCNISSLSTSHTGVYWCQSESGGRSNSLNITVHNGDVILESPVHPVTEGNPLTLRCLYRNTKISDSGAVFYKDDSVLQKQTTEEMTISSVSMSHEGFYHCTHPERGESPKSWVSVKVLSHEKAPQSVLKLLSSVVAASPYVLVTIILAVKCYRARTEPTEDKRPDTVIEAEASS
ncbi:Fc receptor-like protein 5 [Clarias gariepinus]|uniref:Fc receptor-like protein 5 n=1 Tax=Clarias gariepinus TaxID=13013 RepID=UPI00234E3237|nr:Fc receptor-like protein 5 [Clarias gariepinus]